MNRLLVTSLVIGIVGACGSAGPAAPPSTGRAQGATTTAASVQPVAPTAAPTLAVTGGPTVAPSPTSPPLLARGAFKLYGADVDVNATRTGDTVTGVMTVTHADGDFNVDLECADVTEDGVLLLAGEITESSSPYAREGAREVLVLKGGTPVYASFDSEGRPGGDVVPATSCAALLDQVIETGTQTVIGPNGLEPIEGTVELAP